MSNLSYKMSYKHIIEKLKVKIYFINKRILLSYALAKARLFGTLRIRKKEAHAPEMPARFEAGRPRGLQVHPPRGFRGGNAGLGSRRDRGRGRSEAASLRHHRRRKNHRHLPRA